MKKRSRMLTMLLAAAMVLSICGCGADNGKKLIGTWAIRYNLAEVLTGVMGDGFAGFDSPLEMSFCLEYREDGSFTMSGEQESFKENWDKWSDEFITFCTDTMYSELEKQGMDREEADIVFAESAGSSIEEYLRQIFKSEVDVDSFLQGITVSGRYETSENKLYTAMEGDTIDENIYDFFTVSGDTLKLESPEGAEPEELLPGLAYPLEFKKVKPN